MDEQLKKQPFDSQEETPLEKSPNPEQAPRHGDRAASPEFSPVPEQPVTPPRFEQGEKAGELTKESAEMETREEGFLDDAIQGLKQKLLKKKPKPVIRPQHKDDLTIQMEHIMEEGLEDAYKELTPVQRQEFKMKGEETATKIRQLLRATHIKVQKIFQLLLQWLKMLPGISRYFLEQEAKIKLDKMLSFHEYKKPKQ